MPKRKCIFNGRWLSDSKYSAWLQRGAGVVSAKCKLCKSSFDVSNMGETALKCHAGGKKNRARVEELEKAVASGSTLDGLVRGSPVHVAPRPTASSSTPIAPSIASLAVHNDVLTAEVLWTLKFVTIHSSYNSCTGVPELFRTMFLDSEIAKQFSGCR